MTLDGKLLDAYREKGHVTVPGVFAPERIDRAIADAKAWEAEVLAALSEAERGWYVDAGVADAPALRKLDNPVFHRPAFRALASDPVLAGMAEDIVGPGVSVYFSQVFLKPPRGGGPKPVHQDNCYFGPNNQDGLVTAWVALDDADEENGCLFYADGSHREPVHAHVAPEDAPFNLQLAQAAADRYAMTPAPVPRGGVSFHHGNTYHQSGANVSDRPRRAVAFHYVNHDTVFDHPAWPFDRDKVVRIT